MNLKTPSVFLFKKALQLLLFFLSVFLVAEGLWGNQFAPANLTTQWVWVHYRGVLILALLFAGNLFCYACPFIFFRDLVRLFITPKFLFPKKLRNKWTAIILFSLMLFSYEAFALWSSPFKTALVIVMFFLTALIFDSVFKQASFCKYICPIGHFNFLTSTLSPSEVKIKSEQACLDCKTYDCLKGNADHRGCELNLFLPKKSGNLDCTFCMDCAKACPYSNIVLEKVLPAQNLEEGHSRSGVGKIEVRKDFHFAIMTFFFLGFLNAFLMTAPAQRFALNEPLTLAAFFIFFALILPILLFYLPSKLLKYDPAPSIISLLPLGVGMWSAHYCFHFLTGIFAFAPLIGINLPTKWMGISPGKAIPVEFGFLFLGFITSLLLLSKKEKKKNANIYSYTLYLFLGLACAWILLQPMQMRSTFVGIAP